MDVIVALGLSVAAVSAIRGIWSPCGLSMLSSITPMTEAGRGYRFASTARWFLVGGILGGVSLGAIAAGGAAFMATLDLSDTSRYALAATIAIATAGIDLGAFGVELPIFKRQVNDAWLRRYRSWVYGAGFGWQIGFGVATYIMTAGVFLTIALAVTSASPLSALLIGAAFGLVRGAAVYVGRSATTPEALRAVHARLDRWAPLSRSAAAWVQVGAAVLLAGLAWGPTVALAVGLAAAATVLIVGRLGRSSAAPA